MWKSKARGLFTKKLVSGADLSGKDFLISKYDNSFHKNVQMAANVGIPTMLFYENDPGNLTHLNLGEKYWPDDQNVDLQNIINAVMVGGVNGVPRKVYGIMIDCSVTNDHQGKQLDIDFLTQSAKNLGDKAWKYLKLPIYYYMNLGPVNTYKGSDLETLYAFIASCQGISTVGWAEKDENGYPRGWWVDGLLKQRPTLPYDDGQQWPFCFYAVLDGGNLDVISSYTKNGLYGALNFSPPASVNGGDSGDSGDTGDPSAGSGSGDETGSGSEDTVVNSDLESRKVMALERIADALENMETGEEFAATVRLWNIPS